MGKTTDAVKLKPIGDKILVQVLEEQSKSRGGIYLPDTAKEKPQEARVVAVGSGKLLDNGQVIPLELKVGDRVIFAKYSGSEVKIGDQDYLIIGADDVLAKVE